MSNNYFKFKKFTLYQENVAMRVNTDGVLLGAWCSTDFVRGKKEINVLDIGTGSGVIALMMAQKLSEVDPNRDFYIDAVESDFASALCALENFKISTWSNRLRVFNSPFKEFANGLIYRSVDEEEKYDLIISNPPYFTNSLKSPIKRKCMARHNNSLPPEEIVKYSALLLKKGGTLAVVFPPEESSRFDRTAAGGGFFLRRKCRVFTKVGDTSPKRVMTEHILSRSATPVVEEEITIQNSDGLTPEYKAITSGYYL